MKIFVPFRKNNMINDIPSLDLKIINLRGFYIDAFLNIILVKVYCDQLYESMSQTHFNMFLTNNVNIPLEIIYNYYLDTQYQGQCCDVFDSDQYATYHITYVNTYNPIFDYITGSYLNDMNYISCLIGQRSGSGVQFATNCTDDSHFEYYLNTQQKLDENPFLPDSKSTAYYTRNNSSLYFSKRQELLFTLETELSSSLFSSSSGTTGTNPTTGQIYVYRLDKESTQDDFAGEEATDGCLSTYLFCKKGVCNTLTYGIMRIKIPYCYDSSLPLIQPMKQYDVLYYSVSAMQYELLLDHPFAPFWTVNTRMMKTYQDENGYTYIFWAPQSDVMLINDSQQLIKKTYEPPVITWGQYTGYLLCAPTMTFYFRYKSPILYTE